MNTSMPSRPVFGQPVPPPYRAPPRLPYPQQQQQGTPAYSKFNVSEPNVAASNPNNMSVSSMTNGAPTSGYDRHTINHEHSQRVQHGLRNMLGPGPKHATLDSQGQNAALQHLRSNGLQPQMDSGNQNGNSSDAFASPDALRDTANRLFTRNQNDRASFGGVATNGISPQGGPQQRPAMNQQQQQQQHLQQQQVGGGPSRYSTPRTPQMTSLPMDSNSAKRLSYTNQSFRKALAQEQQQQGKVPPQVPPKPFSRSTSRERLKDEIPNDSNAAANALDDELRNILSGGRGGGFGTSSGTPPLPAMSPLDGAILAHQQHPTYNNSRQQQQSADTNGGLNHRPDLLGDAEPENANKMRSHNASGKGLLPPGAALDLERVLAVTGGGDTSATDDENDDDDEQASTTIDMGDAASIRKQLDGLENMYSEVLKLLGLRKYGRQPNGVESRTGGFHGRRSKMYGSMSSLPSVSSIGSRHLFKGERRNHHKTDKARSAERSANGGTASSSGSRDRNHNKRFQRLESHVVTLARSVAHLSSEMRSQHLIVQEMEALRSEVDQLRAVQQQQRQTLDPEQFFHLAHGGGTSSNPNFPVTGIVSPLQANRVKKLTKFFGDEPPLLRLFLKNLGYEKYAAIFEEAKIGLLELPYLAEERLEKLGIPLGPRMRIMQECRVAAAATQGPLVAPQALHQHQADAPNYNVYIL